MAYMAQAQVGRFRKKKPVFSACIVSHTGEWSQGVLQTIEWLGEQRRAGRRELFGDRRAMGSAADKSHFRSSIKDGTACTTARGLGRILSTGGHCFLSRDGEGAQID